MVGSPFVCVCLVLSGLISAGKARPCAQESNLPAHGDEGAWGPPKAQGDIELWETKKEP
jgi:hypothetical protein